MKSITTKRQLSQSRSDTVHLFDDWFDPIEAEVRERAREFIEELIRGELDATLARPRYGRGRGTGDEEGTGISGYRHGQRTRSLTGTFGPIRIEVPRARLNGPDGKTTEWKSSALRAYQRRTLAADALIASTYLAGTNTRRVRRALAALFGGAVGKDTVSRVWRKVKTDWDAWNARSLADEPIVRLILDGTVVRVRLDRKATAISLLVVSVCTPTARRCCWRSGAWAARAPRLGARCSTISSNAGCGSLSSSSSMARQVSTKRSPPSGTACRCSAARSISIATCWPTRPSACTRRSPPTTTI